MHLLEDATVELSEEQRAELEKAVRSRRTPQAVAVRARIVLMTAGGMLPGEIGQQLGVSQPTIRKWRARYPEQGAASVGRADLDHWTTSAWRIC
jgi:transposase-like protein